MAPKYRLTYFNARGYAEFIRYLLAYLKIDYEDIRLDYGSKEWPELKPNVPFGKLPVLEFDDEAIGESRAIARYIAKEHDLAGKDNLESAKCDMIVSALRDFIENRWKWLMENDSNKKEELRKKLVEEDCPHFFGSLMKQMKDSKYLVGDSLTWADIVVANSFYDLRNDFPGIFKSYKALNDHIDMVHNLPGIKEWIINRPKNPW